MASEYGVFNQGSVVLEYWLGEVTLDEMLQHELIQNQDALIHNQSIVVVDCRDAVFQLTPDCIEQFSQVILNRPRDIFHKVALIIHPDSWELATDYSQRLWQSNKEVMAFHSLDAASVWLDLDSKNLQKRLTSLKATCMASIA
ncbi:MAG: hypothetical protein HWE18_10345 [Gammaproteobacteria bacterium]|nr:hypothetical protein [Gammaproteobacteria bacterium]